MKRAAQGGEARDIPDNTAGRRLLRGGVFQGSTPTIESQNERNDREGARARHDGRRPQEDSDGTDGKEREESRGRRIRNASEADDIWLDVGEVVA
jgi:hypothetical protein